MTGAEINALIEAQQKFFLTGATLDVKFRIAALRRLKQAIKESEGELIAALKADLGKSATESYMCEVGITLAEITYLLKHIKKYSKEKRIKTPLAQFASRSYQKPSPYGNVLIMSPWNYPLLLTLEPLCDALAAGNTAVLKPSAYSPHTTAAIKKLIESVFPPEYVAVVTGGRAENNELLSGDFDYIFFTGSQAVGKEVMRRAAERLIPVTLELGGKSPCIVEKSANIPLAAKRIVFGKFLNCGQTCVAPDYIFCDKSVKQKLVEELKKQICMQFGEDSLKNPDYGKMINDKHFTRVCGLIDESKVVAGGTFNADTLQIAPTVMDNVTFGDKVMGEEIFGPVLPILTYDGIEGAVEKINSMQHPLALYVFTNDKKVKNYVTSRCGFGGGCINDVIIHLATSEMGFGGFGESGMGSYHGKAGFDAFSHYKSMVDKKNWIDLSMRYQPYKKKVDKLIRLFLK